MRRFLLTLLSLALLVPVPDLGAQVPSPREVLGYDIGESFTTPTEVTEYARRLSEASERVGRRVYGRTPEGRPLQLLVISRPEHLQGLEGILDANGRLTDPGLGAEEAARIARSNPAVAWFTYGIHGDESASTEAALWTAHDLATAEGEAASVLDSLVVVLDPMGNPDGRGRYVSWYRSTKGAEPNPSPEAREHHPRWPSGRYNHYLFDLNRDWAFATQPETRARLREWRQWNPQVHVDFHEMSWRSSYFFFPPARPHNPIYPDYTFRWSEYFGQRNASAFDRRGWLYFTEESYDFFYPGYGDTWPSLVGAIGMTYEQAGGGAAGLVVDRPDGSTLTLTDRATHHRVSGRTTLRAAADRKTELLLDFAAFHRNEGEEAPGVLLVPGPDDGPARALLRTLERQGVTVRRAAAPFRTDAEAYPGFGEREQYPVGTLYVPGEQPRARLAQTLLRPDIPYDSAGTRFTYDITSWTLPYAFGVEAHRVTDGAPDADWESPRSSAGEGGAPGSAPAYGYLVPPTLEAAGGVHRYLEAGGRARALQEEFRAGSRSWPEGTYFLPADSAARERLASSGLVDVARAVSSGRTPRGPDLGTGEAVSLEAPRIGVLSGEGISPSSLGNAWYLLENRLDVSHDNLPARELSGPALEEYDVLYVPSGYGLDGALGESGLAAVRTWVRGGGTLVAVGDAARWATDLLEGVEVRRDTTRPSPAEQVERGLRTLEERRQAAWRDRITGVSAAVAYDSTHPLAAGTGRANEEGRLFVLHEEDLLFRPDPSYETVVHFPAGGGAVAGRISATKREELARGAWMVTREEGRGRVILFADDPLYRLFWRSTFHLVANALLVGPSL